MGFNSGFKGLNNLQRHVSALENHLQAEYKGVYIIQCRKIHKVLNY